MTQLVNPTHAMMSDQWHSYQQLHDPEIMSDVCRMHLPHFVWRCFYFLLYYSSIMCAAWSTSLFQKLRWHNGLKPKEKPSN